MSNVFNGWIPFGSDDDSILGQASCKTQASLDALSGTVTTTGSGLTFSNDGMDTNGSGGIKIATLTGYANLDNAGQISFDAPRSWVCFDDAAAHTTGLVPSANEVAIGLGSDQIATKTTSETMSCLLNGAQAAKELTDGIYNAAQSIPIAVNSGGRKETIRVQLGWMGSRIFMAFDDYIYAGGQMTGVPSNDFANIYLGSLDGTNNYMSSGYPIKNLLISNKPPIFPVHTALRKVSFLSDSSMKQDAPNGTFRDGLTSQYFRGELARRGFRCGAVSVDVNGSHTIVDTATNNLSDRITALTAEYPQIVILSAGSNDVVTDALPMDQTWDTGLKSLLTSILAISSVEKVIVRTVPSLKGDASQDTVAHRARRVIANDYIEALPSWNANVYVADFDVFINGESALASYFIGSDLESYDDFHLTPAGHYQHGVCYANTVLNAI